jgi:shikimate dehydrogenase
MHRAAYGALGLAHSYEAVHATAAELPAVVARLRSGEIDGLNVTVPHKERVLSLVDTLDRSARIAGAANTLVRGGDGRLVAYNTDAPALAAEIASLAGDSIPWQHARALVIGSGGAARAATVALGLTIGVTDVVVRARGFDDVARARAFEGASPCSVAAQRWAPDPQGERLTRALVQATSAGMQGADDGRAVAGVVAWDDVPPDAIAIDVVYAPRDTPWLKAARARGLRADNGLGMLARQGALALELWLEVPAPLAVMRAALD